MERRIIADFGSLSVRAYVDATLQSVPLGTLQMHPEWADLEPGQAVLLNDLLGPLHAEGRIVRRSGVCVWRHHWSH